MRFTEEENTDLKIRSSGVGSKYYQIGYYSKGKWIQLEHIGTARYALKLIRLGKCYENTTD